MTIKVGGVLILLYKLTVALLTIGPNLHGHMSCAYYWLFLHHAGILKTNATISIDSDWNITLAPVFEPSQQSCQNNYQTVTSNETVTFRFTVKCQSSPWRISILEGVLWSDQIWSPKGFPSSTREVSILELNIK